MLALSRDASECKVIGRPSRDRVAVSPCLFATPTASLNQSNVMTWRTIVGRDPITIPFWLCNGMLEANLQAE